MLEDVRWFKKYLLLAEYKKTYGNCNVAADYVTNDGFKLGKWLKSQRSAYNHGKLSEDKISFLRGLDVDFTAHKAYWNEMYSILEKYYLRNGNSNVSTHAETKNMGSWVNNQRKAYNGIQGQIDRDEIALLNKLDFEWSKRNTLLLNREISSDNIDKYKTVMLTRMKHILEDLSYEIDGNITDKKKQKQIEEKIIKRMWR